MTLGEKIQKYRKERRMSQEDLAALLGVSRQAVSKWELNDTIPDTENVIQLGRILGVSLDYLLTPERESHDECGKVGPEKPDRPGKRGRALVGWGIYLAVVMIFLVMMWWNSSFGVGVANAVNITVLAVFVYIVWLLIKALKKYIQK